jgi:hypothetical protein
VYLKEDNVKVKEKPQIKELFSQNKVEKKVIKRVAKKRVVKKEVEYVEDDSRVNGLLEVTNVRWSQHNGFERLVFDISADGDNDVGICKIEPDTDSTMYINGELIGYSSFVPYLPTFSSSQIIKDMKVVENSNGNFDFTIKFNVPVAYKAFALKNPPRIVIDLY